MKEVFSTEESGVGVLFGLVIILCFFWGRGIGIGNVEWDVFWFLGGRYCFVATTVANTVRGHGVKGGCGSRLISRRVGFRWKSFVLNRDPKDRVFIINWDHDCFVVDFNGVKGSSWSPGSPVILDIKVSLLDEGSKEVELVVVGMHADEDDAIISAQGEDSRGSEVCAGEFMVDGRHGCWE